jgi:hypothetical protein
MDNYDPNQAAADALKHGMNGTNAVSALMSLISEQVQRLKQYQKMLQGAELSMLINNTVFNLVSKLISEFGCDNETCAEDLNAYEALLSKIQDVLKGPDLQPGTPEEMQKQVNDWIQSLGEKE